jgi:kynurenine 3-monooxygenase
MLRLNRFNYSQEFENYGYKELEIIPGKDGLFQMEKNALHIWPRGEFMMIALPNPDATYTCTLFLAYDGENSFSKLTDKTSLEAFFKTNFADAVSLMPGYPEDFFRNPTGSLTTIRCKPWVHKRTVLVGDAAHAVITFYGQGMNCSFEDVDVFNKLLIDHYPDWDHILAEYEGERIGNANAIADLACKNFVEMRDKVGRADFIEFKKIENQLSKIYPDHFQSQYELVSFTTRPYSYAQSQGDKNEALIRHIQDLKLEERIDDRNTMMPLFEKFFKTQSL